MFTPAGAQSRVKRTSRNPRLSSTDQPAVPLGGPPSYSYGSPNNGLPIAPTLGETGISIASAFKQGSIDESPSRRDDNDDATSQYSISSSRASRKRTPSIADVQASQKRRQSLRSAAKSGDVTSVYEDVDVNDENGPDLVSLDYDVTQSSQERSHDTFDEYPSKVTHYGSDMEESDANMSALPGKVDDPMSNRSEGFLESLRFIRFLVCRLASTPLRLSDTLIRGAWRNIRLSFKWVRDNVWRLSMLLLLLGILSAAFTHRAILRSSFLGARGPSGIFSPPAELPSSMQDLAYRLQAIEQSLSKYSSMTNDIQQQLVIDKMEKDASSSTFGQLQNQIKDVFNDFSEMQAQLKYLEKHSEDISRVLDDISENSSHSSPGTALTTGELENLKSALRSQEDMLSQVQRDLAQSAATGIESADTRANQAQDVTSHPDYASYLAGARINPFLTSATYLHRPQAAVPRLFSSVFGIGSIRSHPPAMAIHPSTEVGMCWAFPGSSGQLGVKLSHAIYLTEISIEHVRADVSLDSTTAPKEIEIWGEVADDELMQHMKDEEDGVDSIAAKIAPDVAFIHLMDVTYDAYHSQKAVQSFAVPHAIRQRGVPFRQVVFRVKSNWGSDAFTCIYRVRANGHTTIHANDNIADDETV